MLNLNEQTLTAYQEKIRAQIKEMKARMTILEAEAEKSSADVRVKYQKRLDDLKSRFKDIEMRLDRFSNSAEDAWDEIRTGIDKSMKELRAALDNATKHINN
jgi:ElaB/YqjD/DUF883 family membrane-anchored ribosome-binding protein